MDSMVGFRSQDTPFHSTLDADAIQDVNGCFMDSQTQT